MIIGSVYAYRYAAFPGVLKIAGGRRVVFRHYVPGTPPDPDIPDAPTLTQTSSSGTNPMRWSASYTNIAADSDYIRCRWRYTPNGGSVTSWTYETDHLFTSEDYFDSIEGNASFEWPLYMAHAFAQGDFVEVQEGVSRNGTTSWSNTLSDTLVKQVQIAYLNAFSMPWGFSASALTTGSISVQDQDKIVIGLLNKYNTGAGTNSHTIVVKNASNGATIGTPTIIGTRVLNANQYWMDLPTGVSAVTITVTPNGSAYDGSIVISAVRNAAAGAPAGYSTEDRDLGGTNPHVLNGPSNTVGGTNLTVSTNGAVLIQLIDEGSHGVIPFTGATKIGEDTTVDNYTPHVAVQTVSGNVTIPGNGETGGLGYSSLAIFNTSWST